MTSNQFKTIANLGVGGGVATMFIGSGLARQGPELLLAGAVTSLAGWSLLIWGCVNYMRWKGYSGWFGLFGYLLVPGLIVLACLPNRRARIMHQHDSEHATEGQALAAADRRSGARFLLNLVPLVLLFIGLTGFLVSSHSNIDASEWKDVAPADSGFRGLMPGIPRLELKSQETPVGKVELRKFIVRPKDKNELFMIVVIRFPEEVADEFGGPEKLLELGRQDVIAASQGKLQCERRIHLGDVPGIELEVLPLKGAIVKGRVYATNDHIYQVTVHVPKIRLSSDDVQKFLDSFRFSSAQDASNDREGM